MKNLNPAKAVPIFQQQYKAATALGIKTDAAFSELERDEAYTAHLATIIESSDDAIMSKSLDGMILSWNGGSERMFGYTAKQALGKPGAMLIPSDYHQEGKNILEIMRNNECVDHLETVRNRMNGEAVNVSLTVSPLKNKRGVIIGSIETAKDITQQKQSETKFSNILNELAFQNEEKEKRATELIIANKELAFQNDEKENRAAELIVANRELAFQNAEKEKRAAELLVANKELIFQNQEKENRAAELIVANRELAFQNAEKEKRAAELLVANKELIFQNQEKENRAAELIVANRELAFQNEEKEKRAAELLIANEELIFQNREKENRAAELIIAISDLKVASEQIIEVNKELEAFSYSVSHDLRAPLRAIGGYASMLKSNFENQLDPEANRLMTNIVQNAKKMGLLIDDLLTFSRIGRRELIKKITPMHALVQGVCRELKDGVPDRNIEFRIDNLLPALADNVAIKQVWLNLVDNAIKYSRLKDKAIIEIGSETDGEYVTYSIKDNGAGFDMLYANKLFGVFQRLHSDEEFEGSGVGLALVQRIILKHGGRVWANATVNEGAIFYFTLHKP